MKNILFSLAILIFSITAGKTQCNHPDYAGLMELYYSTGGPNWTNNTGWKEGAAGTNCNPCIGWWGVTCINNRVTGINLSSNNLVGVIPNFSSLLELKKFDCEINQLTGSIPNFTNLPNLQFFDCQGNQLTGSIPNFTNLPNLIVFICDENQLTGSIPNFNNTPRLSSFGCGENLLTGNIPNFTNLSNLVFFDCQGNQLTGSIPNFNNIPRLSSFGCGDNLLTGNIPNFTNLPNLQEFNCFGNQLTGSIPNFTNLPSLQVFDCKRNQLTGSIPNFNNTPRLWSFGCGDNLLTGNIPNFTNLPNLESLSCSGNQLTGSIPNSNNINNLNLFLCSNNQLTGALPIFIKDSIIIDFSSNNLAGCIPSSYCIKPEINFSGAIRPRVLLINNPKLPYQGDIVKFCENGGISTGAPCDDGLVTTIEDHILPDCSCLGAIADTCLVTIYDTLIVRDTITEIITDTTFITITKEVAVMDTLIINLNLMNSANQPVENHILIYPNPASSHIYIDMGDHTLLDNYDMQILNALGQPVYFTTIDKKLYYLDLNAWSGKGTYFVKIKNPAGITIQTKKIVLQ